MDAEDILELNLITTNQTHNIIQKRLIRPTTALRNAGTCLAITMPGADSVDEPAVLWRFGCVSKSGKK